MSENIKNYSFVLIAAFLSSVSLSLTKNIMIPFILSVFLAFILQPMIDLMEERLKVRRSLAIVLLCVILISLSSVFFVTIGASFKQIANNASTYQERITSLVEAGMQVVSKLDGDFDREQLREVIKDLPFFTALKTISNALIKGVSDFFLISIFTLFIMSGPKISLPRSGVWPKINRSIRTYLLTKSVTSLITGSLTAIILQVLGLDMAMMFGLLAFFLNFIPTFGSVFATLLPIPIAILQFSSPLFITLSIALPGLVQFLIGNIIEPKIMGQSLDLHPVTILLSLMFWGFLWGVPGMILATPLAVIFKIVLQSKESTQHLADYMAGRLNFAEGS